MYMFEEEEKDDYYDYTFTTPPSKKDKVVELVREDLLKRSQVGIKKYGVTLDRKDLYLKDWLQAAYEECLDQANYLKRAICEIEEQEKKDSFNPDEVLPVNYFY